MMLSDTNQRLTWTTERDIGRDGMDELKLHRNRSIPKIIDIDLTSLEKYK